MKLNPNELPEHIRKLNPHLFVGGVETRFTEQAAARALGGCFKKCKSGKAIVAVSLVQYRRRALDSHDNLRSACKPLVDAIAASLGIDDGDNRIRWEYGQIETRGQEGTAVRIEVL